MKTILAATDFSTPGNNAVEYAFGLASYLGCRLILIHVVAPPAPFYYHEDPLFHMELGLVEDSINAQECKRLEELRSIIDRQYCDMPAKLNVCCEVTSGVPANRIGELAREWEADLIIVGFIGDAGKIRQFVMGSTALSLARHQDLPTLMVPENVRYARIHRISYACDIENPENARLLYNAKYFASLFSAELEIVNVQQAQHENVLLKTGVEGIMESHLKWVKYNITYLDGDHIGKVLEEHFNVYPTDIIMLNPHKHNLFYYLFNRSVTRELAFNTHLPILAIK